MVSRYISIMAVASIVAAPAAAFAQARDANIYNGMDHQPTASGVQSEEKADGVAPTARREAAENRDLAALNQQLLHRAQEDANAVPTSNGNVYGVQPGGVVVTTPNAGGNGAAAGR